MTAQKQGSDWLGALKVGVVAVVLMLGGVCLLVSIFSPASPGGGSPPAATANTPARTPNVRLGQTVLYKSRIGFSVCSRLSLHRCSLAFTTDAAGSPATIRIGPVDVEPAADCEHINGDAIRACADAGAAPSGLDPVRFDGPSASWLRCAALHGFIYRGGPNTTQVDPRDAPPSARPGDARLECDEGHVTGSFDDTL